MKVPAEIKKGWEDRFPSLDGKWTHWKITGTGQFIALIDGLDLIGALNVVEENYGKYLTIKACRATATKNGDLDEEEKALFEISRLEYDEMIRVPDEAPDT
jgi:hypothetical protein